MKTVRAVISALVVLLLAQTASFAHFLWATVDNNQVRFALLEDATASPNPAFEKYVANLSPVVDGRSIPLGPVQSGARFASLASGQQVVSVESPVGVKERSGETYLLVYHARGAATLNAAGGHTQAPAEVSARREGNSLIVTVHSDGWAVPHAEAWAQFPGEQTPQSARTDFRGEARFPWATGSVNASGFVGIRALVKEAKAGQVDGKQYAIVHRWATLTFPITQSAQNSTDKKLSQVLRESFGKNHDVVGHSAFNQIVFSGKLTQKQLVAHLQQRALIHNELHRILNGAAQDLSLPYGAPQKNVLILLFQDLIALDSGWPTEAQAHPLTRAFLQEIRDSEKEGPYFALGVHHVYYGGITNGGRMIGAKIGETVKFTPAYYEKSDGYADYLNAVNQITDPKARQEMIQGGQAAYRYIIAISNEATADIAE